MPVMENREYRACQEFRAAPESEDKPSYIVEGYASTFESYVLYDDGEHQISERIEPTAFDKADMTDVIFQYDHSGHVYARQSNGTLEVSVDEHGLKVRADLSKTESSRQMYEEIKAGLSDKMSFAFIVAEDRFDKQTQTRVITRVHKVFDVSAVSQPANPTTSISARAYCEGVIAEAKQELLEQQKAEEERAAKIKKIKIMLEVSKDGI